MQRLAPKFGLGTSFWEPNVAVKSSVQKSSSAFGIKGGAGLFDPSGDRDMDTAKLAAGGADGAPPKTPYRTRSCIVPEPTSSRTPISPPIGSKMSPSEVNTLCSPGLIIVPEGITYSPSPPWIFQLVKSTVVVPRL